MMMAVVRMYTDSFLPACYVVLTSRAWAGSDFMPRVLASGASAPTACVGPYRVRGAELTRFLSETPSTPWLAIHVLRTSGKTLIFFVPRPKA
jgi:hypothetical protein